MMALKAVRAGGRLPHPLLSSGLVMPVMMVHPSLRRAAVDHVANGYFARLRVKPTAWPIAWFMSNSISLAAPHDRERSNSDFLYRAPRTEVKSLPRSLVS